MKRFETKDAIKPEPIVFEQVFAEKPNGGIVTDPGVDIPAGTAVYESNGKYVAIADAKVAASAQSTDTTVKIAKGSKFAVGDTVYLDGTSLGTISSITKTNAAYDTLTFGSAIGSALSKGAHIDDLDSDTVPVYVTGNIVYGGMGDQPVRLINGANVRKETASFGAGVAALLPTINLV